jgi:hypothetical protein
MSATARTIQVCEHCHEERSRAEFYQTACYTEGEWQRGVYIPGPSRGEHVWVTVEAPGPVQDEAQEDFWSFAETTND